MTNVNKGASGSCTPPSPFPFTSGIAAGTVRGIPSLESFAAGFKLALGIAREMHENGLYSYEAEETTRSIMVLEKQARERTK